MSINYLGRLFLTGLLLLVTNAMADAYKWVDKYGVTNYSQDKPENFDAILIKAPPIPAIDPKQAKSNVDDLKDKQNDQSEQVLATQQVELENAQNKQEFCDTNRLALEQYQNNPHGRIIDANGDVTRLSEEQRQQKMMDIQQRLDEHCQET